MIESGFHRVIRAESIGSSGDHSDLVVQTPDGLRGDTCHRDLEGAANASRVETGQAVRARRNSMHRGRTVVMPNAAGERLPAKNV